MNSNERFGRLLMGGVSTVLMLVLMAACGGADATETPSDGAGTATPTEGAAMLKDEIGTRGYIRIGFANEAPYGYADESGNVTGEAPEVAKAVLSEMGISEVDGVVVPFGSLIPGLQASRFDMIAAGMFINPDRCEQILFSDPDYAIPQAFGVEAGNPQNLTNFSDVAANPDVTLGVLGGAVEEEYARANGVSDDQLQIFDDAPSMGEALAAGRIDAFALTTLSVREQIERLDDPDVAMSEPFTAVVDGEEQIGAGGYGFRPENQAFRDEFNQILNEMQDNNEILPIVEPFGFGEAEVEAAKDLTAEELCGN